MAILNLTINRGTTFGGVQAICKDANGSVVPLAGYRAYAHVRKTADSSIVIDLAPTIEADDADGLITIPALTPAETSELPAGSFPWDMILEDDTGVRSLEPLFVGNVTISKLITQPE